MLRLLKTKPVPVPQTPEGDLVRRAQAGDGAAFRVLFERHVPSVRRFLKDLLRDDFAADEATQETFVRAHSLLPRLADRERLKAFLLGIARNVAFEHHRLRQHVSLDADEGDEGFSLQAVIPSPDPEAVLLDRELHAVFARALEALSPHRRAALVLRLDHGLAYEEIAESFGWSLQKVKNEIHRARLTVRAALAPHLTGAP